MNRPPPPHIPPLPPRPAPSPYCITAVCLGTLAFLLGVVGILGHGTAALGVLADVLALVSVVPAIIGLTRSEPSRGYGIITLFLALVTIVLSIG